MEKTTELNEDEGRKKVERKIYFICMRKLFGIIIISSIMVGVIGRMLSVPPLIIYIVSITINIFFARHYYKDYERMKKDPALSSKLFVYDMMMGKKVTYKDFPESKNNLENNKNN